MPYINENSKKLESKEESNFQKHVTMSTKRFRYGEIKWFDVN